MASTTNDKKPCSKCGSGGWVFPCDGCHASFCLRHASEHRIELTTQLNHIQDQCNHLQHIHNQHEEHQEHPLFSQIDVWEHDTIAKIEQTAHTARNELRQLLEESNNRLKTIFNQFNNQLQTGRQTDHYTEIELDHWKEELMNIKKQLESPCDIELISDKNLPPIYLIKVNTTKPNTLIQNPSVSQSYEESNNLECSCDDDDELKPSQSIILESNKECPPVLEQHEPSVIPKEEREENLVLWDTIATDCGIFLDPIKNHQLILLQLSPNHQSQLLSILNQLTDHELEIIDQNEDCQTKLLSSEQATIFIDLFDTSLNEQNCLLDNISQLNNVYFIYIRGTPSEDDNERADFFRRYSKIKGIFDNEQRLIVQWAIDTANEYKKTGDMYVTNSEKDKGRQCFEQGILLYKRLSVFLNEKRRIR